MKLEEALNMASHVSVAVEVLHVDEDGKYAVAGEYDYDELSFSAKKTYDKCEVIGIGGKVSTSMPSYFDGTIHVKPVVVFTIEVE